MIGFGLESRTSGEEFLMSPLLMECFQTPNLVESFGYVLLITNHNLYYLITGECYTATECSGRGGSYTSSCATGLGVCCYIVQESCGAATEITFNNTYIRSPGYAGESLYQLL